ncbi:PadR family transcriptional regulator [Xylocopilactobacillus apis]|uniref:PadR family transcriptional regulator n=1 Tax=Xylocopilactobacillus apis TaxID=2932183 RepID=A0AAU9DRJ4_9LACO|nr:PadR family transcriptional regulator [Xylocopilactobacillus apis]BDR56283.1 PadR family transcriptional regulator [Xylocopilactobacillus apis]
MKGKDIILGLLNSKGGLTGYQINDILHSQLRHFYDGGFGMIYPTLKNLEKDGLIYKDRIEQEDKPSKNVFFITESGKEEFKQSVNKKTEPDIIKSDFLMKLYFGEFLEPGKAIEFLKEELHRKKADLSDLKDNLSNWDANGMSDDQRFSAKYGIEYYKAVIKVIEEHLKNKMDGD